MTPEQIAVLVAALLPALIMTLFNRRLNKVDTLEARMGQVENRLTALEAQTPIIVGSLNRIESRFERFEEKFDRVTRGEG